VNQRSLQQRLSSTLSAALLLAAVLAGSMSFWLAYEDATETQDDLLRQVAGAAAGASRARAPAGATQAEPEARLLVLHFPQDARPGWMPAALSAGLHTLAAPGGPMRLFAAGRPGGAQTVAGQATAISDDLAFDSAMRTLIPFILLIPVQALLTLRIVRAELAPVNRLAQRFETHAAGQPVSLGDAELPMEIAPFARAIDGLMTRVNLLLLRQRRFVADAAHELRSPLTAIDLQAQNLQRAATLEDMRARLPPLREGIARARRLAEQMLSLAHVEADSATSQAPAAPVAVDLLALARELVAAAMPLAQQAGIDLGFERSGAVRVDGSPEALRRIMGNAIDNALAYTPAGGQVSVVVARINGAALFEVIDDGPGIAAADRARVFDAFVRLPGAQGIGSGLGLSIALEAARKLGGSLSLHERPGRSGLIVRYLQTHL
jgi:two-component system OmpR family sensor kinase